MIKDLINKVWLKVINEINQEPSNFPSEKTMVFRFAWLLQKELPNDLNFVFEKIVLKNNLEKRKKYVDLYFEINNHKIGIEFKFPKKSELSSNNQTQRRIATIKDIERLNEMVLNNEIDLGVFLLASDIRAYTNFSEQRTKSKDYKIHNGHVFKKNEFLPPSGVTKEALVCDVKFDWVDVDKMKQKEFFAYVKPIFIENGKTN